MKKKSAARIAVYPGSFDPLTLGHVDLIERISELYEQVIVLISIHPEKQGLFSIEEKKALIEKSLIHLKNVQVDQHQGLTVNYLLQKQAQVLVRGLRSVVDFEYEMKIANTNKQLAPNVETVMLFTRPELSFISSRGVKEVASLGGSLKGLVPPVVAAALRKKIKKEGR